jgi:hypothetical protein
MGGAKGRALPRIQFSGKVCGSHASPQHNALCEVSDSTPLGNLGNAAIGNLLDKRVTASIHPALT